jgi:glyoxylase I family protein
MSASHAVDVIGIHHVSINVDDLAAALDFYVGQLGFEPLARPDFGVAGAWLQAGAQQVHLLEITGQPRSRTQHWAFQVTSIDRVRQQLDAAGVTWTDGRRVIGAGQQIFVNDPSGNSIEFNQPA